MIRGDLGICALSVHELQPVRLIMQSGRNSQRRHAQERLRFVLAKRASLNFGQCSARVGVDQDEMRDLCNSIPSAVSHVTTPPQRPG